MIPLQYIKPNASKILASKNSIQCEASLSRLPAAYNIPKTSLHRFDEDKRVLFKASLSRLPLIDHTISQCIACKTIRVSRLPPLKLSRFPRRDTRVLLAPLDSHATLTPVKELPFPNKQ